MADTFHVEGVVRSADGRERHAVMEITACMDSDLGWRLVKFHGAPLEMGDTFDYHTASIEDWLSS